MKTTEKKSILKINHSSHIPLHRQIEELLRKIIIKQEYSEGKLFPKEVDLAKQLGVSRNTIRQATNKLAHEGLIRRKKGVGTQIINTPVVSDLMKWSSFSHEMHEKGKNFVTSYTHVDEIKVNNDVYDFFRIPNREKRILKVEKLRGLNENEPLVYFISYLHPRIGLKTNDDFSHPLYEMLEKKFHLNVKYSEEELQIITADKIISEKLRIKIGSPVLYRKRLVSDIGRKPLEFNIGFYRSDTWKWSIELELTKKRN